VLPYAQDLDADKIHVRAPTNVIFLCGGQISSLSEPIPLSLRDAFLKILDNPAIAGSDIIQAEDITSDLAFFNRYDNLLDFETDLAQLVELIVLFCESEGSLAELGAFALINEIAQRLFVIVREKHWNELSFIKLGPLKFIENNYGRDSIYVIDDVAVGLKGSDASGVDINALKALLTDPLSKRLQKPREPSTFDEKRSGHVIKLIVGLVQDYGALRSQELLDLLTLLNVLTVTKQSLDRYILCAEAVGWLKMVSKGTYDYVVAVNTKLEAATIFLKPTAPEKNRTRRRLLIREHWKNNDGLRFSAIAQVFGKVSS
jgi:hypothetical protein